MAKNKAAKAGAGAVAAGKAARSNTYVQRLAEDAALRDDLRAAYTSARKAYSRMDGKAPQKALEDKKVRRDLGQAASSLKSAADALREKPKRKKRRRRGGVLILLLAGAGAAVALNEGLRKKVLDALFGAEEEFEYTSSTTPEPAAGGTTSEPVGA
jgi:adenylosuccinate synthase